MKPDPRSLPEDKTEWTPASLFDPLAQLEVATRINNASLDWMTRAWQQWLNAMMALTTMLPFVQAQPAEETQAAPRAMAHERSKRPARAGVKPRSRSRA